MQKKQTKRAQAPKSAISDLARLRKSERRKLKRARKSLKKRQNKITGSGDYDTGQLLGGALGSLIPIPGAEGLGSWLGGHAERLVRKLFGSGDYVINDPPAENSLFPGSHRPQSTMPSGFQGPDSIFLCRSEFIGNVYGPTTPGQFTYRKYAVTPSSTITFPWLGSTVATGYQEYRPDGIVFEYRSMTSEASTAPQLGTVILCTQYDSSVPDPVGKVQMETLQGASSCKLSKSMLNGLECAKGQLGINWYSMSNPAGTDPRFSIFANQYVAVSGTTVADQLCGELWVHYKYELRKPRPETNFPFYFNEVAVDQGPSGQWTFSPPINAAYPIGGLAVSRAVVASDSGPAQLTFFGPGGSYVVFVETVGANCNNTWTSPSLLPSTAGSITTVIQSTLGGNGSGGGNTAMLIYFLTLTAPCAFVNIGNGNTVISPGASNIWVFQTG